jgi:hypothetical protein
MGRTEMAHGYNGIECPICAENATDVKIVNAESQMVNTESRDVMSHFVRSISS